MARVIPICGRPRWVFPQYDAHHFTCHELEELVRTNGSQPLVRPVAGFKYGSYTLLANELGETYNLPLNPWASILAQREVRGNVVLLAEKEWNRTAVLNAIRASDLAI